MIVYEETNESHSQLDVVQGRCADYRKLQTSDSLPGKVQINLPLPKLRNL